MYRKRAGPELGRKMWMRYLTPGTEEKLPETAVADILFGDYNPAGRLPVTFYKSADQLPAFEDYSMKDVPTAT